MGDSSEISERVCFRRGFLPGTPGSNKPRNRGPFNDFLHDIYISCDSWLGLVPGGYSPREFCGRPADLGQPKNVSPNTSHVKIPDPAFLGFFGPIEGASQEAGCAGQCRK